MTARGTVYSVKTLCPCFSNHSCRASSSGAVGGENGELCDHHARKGGARHIHPLPKRVGPQQNTCLGVFLNRFNKWDAGSSPCLKRGRSPTWPSKTLWARLKKDQFVNKIKSPPGTTSIKVRHRSRTNASCPRGSVLGSGGFRINEKSGVVFVIKRGIQ